MCRTVRIIRMRFPDKKDYHAEKYGKPALYTRNQFKQDLKRDHYGKTSRNYFYNCRI